MLRRSHRLYFRIYLALLASLALAALLIALAWRWSWEYRQDGPSLDALGQIAAELIPDTKAVSTEQRAALQRWHTRLHVNLAVYSSTGDLVAGVGDSLPKPDRGRGSGWIYQGRGPPALALRLPDGRWLVAQHAHRGGHARLGFLATLALIAFAIGIGAYPVVRRLTRRLEQLQISVEALGGGNFSARMPVRGADEVARLAQSFNQAAARIETLINSQKSLLANASHELRSPLARLRMGMEGLQESADPALRQEMHRNIAELDQLIDEILLASRLEANTADRDSFEEIDFTAITAEECAKSGALFDGEVIRLKGNAKLLRRMIRNLLDNANRYGADAPADVTLKKTSDAVELSVCDRGPGIPEGERARIFQPFYRVAGVSERTGGVGLGLALVKQIVEKHGGSVACVARTGGGSCFRVCLPG